MKSLLDVFFSIESTAGTSLLSKYSTSGLFKESHVDIDSSIDTESPSDSVGEKSMLQETVIVGTEAAIVGTEVAIVGRVASFF